ncbi:hypothetical protein HK096_006644, partial [Nowakowskiella sp. JEL0078]
FIKITDITDSVYSVAVLPNDSKIVLGSANKSIKFWHSSSGQWLRDILGHSGNVNSVAFSHDGLCIVSGSDDCFVIVWNVNTGESLLKVSNYTNVVNSVVLCSDSSRIVSGSSDRTVRVWDSFTGTELWNLDHTAPVLSVSVMHENDRIAAVLKDSTVKIWSWYGSFFHAQFILKGHRAPVHAVTFARNGKYIVSGSYDNKVNIWNADSGTVLSSLKGHIEWVWTVSVSEDSSRIVSGSHDNTVKVWEISSEQDLALLEESKGNVLAAAAVSQDRTKMVAASRENLVGLWDISSGKEILMLGCHSSWILSVAIAPNGSCVTSGSNDYKVKKYALLKIVVPFQAVAVPQLTHYKSASSLVHYASSTNVGKSSLYETATLRSKQAANSLRKGQLNNFLLFVKKKSNNTIPHNFNHPQNVANTYGRWGYPGGHGNQWLVDKETGWVRQRNAPDD